MSLPWFPRRVQAIRDTPKGNEDSATVPGRGPRLRGAPVRADQVGRGVIKTGDRVASTTHPSDAVGRLSKRATGVHRLAT